MTKNTPPPIAAIAWQSTQPHKYADRNWLIIAHCRQTFTLINRTIELPSASLYNEIINLKDIHGFRTILAPPDHPAATRRLRTIDGLTHYKKAGYDDRRRPIYKHPPQHWPHFVARSHCATIVPIPPDVAADKTGLVQLLGHYLGNALIRTTTKQSQIIWVLRQPLHVLINHPITFAIASIAYWLDRKND